MKHVATSRRLIATIAVALIGCSAPDETNSGVDAGTSDVSATLELQAGLYQGSTEGDANATLGLWVDDEDWSGTLAIDRLSAFSVRLSAGTSTLTPVAGACANCGGGPFDLTVTTSTSRIQLDVVANDSGPGFLGLVLTPHDGFKPESFPAPDIQMWAGPMVAVDPGNAENPVLDAVCEVSVGKTDGQIQWFDCLGLDTDSSWTSEQRDSWVEDEGNISFSTRDLVIEGELISEDRLVGKVRYIGADATVLGSFDFTKQ